MLFPAGDRKIPPRESVTDDRKENLQGSFEGCSALSTTRRQRSLRLSGWLRMPCVSRVEKVSDRATGRMFSGSGRNAGTQSDALRPITKAEENGPGVRESAGLFPFFLQPVISCCLLCFLSTF